MRENWMSIEEFEEDYEVSDLGRVRKSEGLEEKEEKRKNVLLCPIDSVI